MKYSYRDIELAFEFISSQEPFMNSAVMCKKTGHIYYDSGLGDTDEDFPDEPDEDGYFFIPHKNDLDLGTILVKRYAKEVAPNLAREIGEIFSRKGAYSRFKSLLEENGLLDSWYKFEDSESTKALRAWCRDNGIELEESSTKRAS